jgi:hypothetical protein
LDWTFDADAVSGASITERHFSLESASKIGARKPWMMT